MKLFLAIVLLGLGGIGAGCTPLSRTGGVSGPVASVCARRNVPYHQMPAELARLQRCPAVAVCHGRVSNIETKQIAGWIHNDHLWGPNNTPGSTSTVFTPAEQDAILAAGRARAVAARPGSKMIVSISFFTNIVVGPPYGYIGADAQYGDCLRVDPQS